MIHSTHELPNGHSLSLVEAPAIYSGDRRERWEIQERDDAGTFVRRFVYADRAAATAQIAQLIRRADHDEQLLAWYRAESERDIASKIRFA